MNLPVIPARHPAGGIVKIIVRDNLWLNINEFVKSWFIPQAASYEKRT